MARFINLLSVFVAIGGMFYRAVVFKSLWRWFVVPAAHLGPQCLNTVKTLINQTSGEFILCAMETLWNRLTRAAYQEVRQLTGNRLAERIKLKLNEPDVQKLLDGRLASTETRMQEAA